MYELSEKQLVVTLYGLGGQLDAWGSVDDLVAAMLRNEVIFAAGDKLVFEEVDCSNGRFED